ncbi:MAG: hypothetical protein FJX77_02185 [Armatimonadetes bacterium]|nr:hypothetical protein [Armatimonadota bacterium]
MISRPTRLEDLTEHVLSTAPAADTTAARLRLGSALVGGHASGTWLGGTISGAARIFDFQKGGARVFAVDDSGVLQVGGTAPSGSEVGYFKASTATGTRLIHLENDTNFTASDTPVRYQVKAVLSGAARIGYIGLDRYFDGLGALLISTDAAAGVIFSSNNSTVRARLTPAGNLTCAGGLGCGNSVAAGGLGALSKVAALYALDGTTLLGYVPIYGSYS